ncbi:unnamed protein product [Fusarium graminearum]|nr:unnamed protein product [Fusarium graminearum]
MDCDPERLRNLVKNDEVEFDADIAGLGVLIAFVATSVSVIIVLVSAFVTLSIPSYLLNIGDAVIASGIRRLYHRLLGAYSKPKHAKVVDTRNERIAAYKAFLHSTSDQLLVSQVAIMIAALATREEITIYSCNIVIALACLASTVHLGCFPFYMDRLKDHRAAKLIRILAMVSGLGTLIFLLIIQCSLSWDETTHVYLKCAMQDYTLFGFAIVERLYRAFIPFTVIYCAWEVFRLSYKQQSRDIESTDRHPPDQQSTSLLTGVIGERHPTNDHDIEMQPIVQIPSRLQEYLNGNDSLILSQIEQEALAVYEALNLNFTDDTVISGDRGCNDRQPTLAILQQSAKPTSIKDTWQKTRGQERNAVLNKWLQMKSLHILLCEPGPCFRLKLRIGLLAERWAFHQCRGSFVWRFCWLLSGTVYGIASIFDYRSNKLYVSGNIDHWGFGQVVPLALLTLPLFAAMESHADYKRQVKSIEASYHETSNGSTERISTDLYSNHCTASQEPVRTTRCPNDIEAILFVIGLLKKRAEIIGHPHLYDWVRGISLDMSSTLQIATGCHAIFMLAFTVVLGVNTPYRQTTISFILVVLLLTMATRKFLGLILIVKATRGLPTFLEKRGGYIYNVGC